MSARALASALALGALAAHAQPVMPSSEIELGASTEQLSGSRAGWRSTYLEGRHELEPRRVVYGGARWTERFDLRDSEIWLGYARPLARSWTATLEASASETHRVLPRSSLFGLLAKELGAGWVASAGWRHSEYDTAGTNVLLAGVERYWKAFRAAYTLYAGRPEGGSTGHSHRLQLDYYYTERSNVGISLSSGREVENVGPPTGVVSTNIRNATLSGRHWLSPAWAVSWELLAHEQGDLYRRSGLRLGIRHRF